MNLDKHEVDSFPVPSTGLSTPTQISYFQLLSVKEVSAMLRIGRSTLYEKVKPGHPRYDPDFPRPVKLSPGSVRFVFDEIVQWMLKKTAASALPNNGRV